MELLPPTRLVLIQSMYKQKDILQEILWAVQNFKDLLGALGSISRGCIYYYIELCKERD